MNDWRMLLERHFQGFTIVYPLGSAYGWIRCQWCGHGTPIERGELPELLDELDAHRARRCTTATGEDGQ